MNENGKQLELTANEKARAEVSAFQAFEKIYSEYTPPPASSASDLVHENEKVMDILSGVIGLLPALLGVIMTASMFVSLDKTLAAFEASVANEGWLWVRFVTICGAIMVEGALVYVEFALVRDMLSKNLRREVFNFADIARRWRVLRGVEMPRDYHEIPDQSLRFYSRFLFWLVIAANVFSVSKAANIEHVRDLNFVTGLLLFTGIAGALSLRMVGKQMAHYVYELARKQEGARHAEVMVQWRNMMIAEFEAQAQALINEELHRLYCKKNKLSPGESDSPYMLIMSGGELDAIPLAQLSARARSNGSH